jgi:hypothetical protein
MRKILMRSGLGALAVIVLTSGTAAAADVLEAKVPFPFVVNGQTMPAGQYTIERSEFGSSVLLIRGERGNRVAAFVGVRPTGEKSPSSDRPALQFKKHENEYKLSAVWESAYDGVDVMN